MCSSVYVCTCPSVCLHLCVCDGVYRLKVYICYGFHHCIIYLILTFIVCTLLLAKAKTFLVLQAQDEIVKTHIIGGKDPVWHQTFSL